MVNLMEWQKHQQQEHNNEQNQNQSQTANVNGGMMYVKVMTEEQLETLRKQIAIYASICEQLVDMHKQLTAQQDLAGVRLGNIYCDPFMASAGHKITSRQRWTPTPGQLKILEEIFENGIGTPTKQKIKEITAQLIHHGQISETNVYNWFQNRRARSKRKQQNLAPSNAESEVETEVESSKDKKTKPEEFQSQHSGTTRPEEMCHQSLDECSDIHYVNPQSNKPDSVFSSHGSLKSARTFGQMSDFDGVLSNSRIGVPGNYNLYQQAGDCNMTD